MILTDKEISRVRMLVRSMQSAWPLMIQGSIDSPGVQIAALRYHIALSGAIAVKECVLLCKLIENSTANDARMFVVTTAIAPLINHPVIAQLLPQYRRTVRSSSSGTWANRAFEAIMLSILSISEGYTSAPCIFERDHFVRLIAAYRKQAEESLRIPEVESTRAQLAEELLLSSSGNDRKRAAKDSRGACWLCSAPKPRKTVCVVCGYAPRTRSY